MIIAKEIIFDIETKKLFSDLETPDPAQLEASIVSLFFRTINQNFEEQEGKMISLWEKDLDRLWPLFYEADRIIGFNSLGFDIPVLQAYTDKPLQQLPHLDILAKIKSSWGKRISLSNLAKINLGEDKTDQGINAVAYFYQGDETSLKKLQSYCEADVAITKRLYDLILREKRLKVNDRQQGLVNVDLDFSYPDTFWQVSQEKLF